MSSVPSLPRCLFLALPLWLLPLGGAAAPASADLNQAWGARADNRLAEAQRVLGAAPSTRPAQLAWAVAEMTRPPVTEAHRRAAERVFQELARGDDEVGAQAEYLRARLHQLHDVPADETGAAGLYRALAARRPHSHWAQLGLVKLALLELYRRPDPADAAADRLAPAEAALAQIEEPALRRDLHLQIGQAGVALQQPLGRLLPHLVAADRLGGLTSAAREDLIVQIGVLSLRAGQLDQAQAYFARYLQDYPANTRAYTVTQLQEQIRRRRAQESAP